MANYDIQDIFEDCVERMANGETIADCLRRYPQHADELRSLLNASAVVQGLGVPEAEILEDQELVWERIEGQLGSSSGGGASGGIFRFTLLFAATMILFGAMAIFAQQVIFNDDDGDLVESVILTATVTLTQTQTATVTNTPTQTSTATNTPTQTSTATNTPTQTSTATNTPTPTSESACGPQLTEAQITEQVLEIYPNASITRADLTERYEDVLVWDVRTSHGLRLFIDAFCGTIYEILSGNDANDSDDGGDDSTDDASGGVSSDDDDIDDYDDSDDDDDLDDDLDDDDD